MLNIIKLNAGHDANGNPLKCYVLTEGSCRRMVYDEGYAGYNTVPIEYQEMAKNCYTVDTKPAVYREHLKWVKDKIKKQDSCLSV